MCSHSSIHQPLAFQCRRNRSWSVDHFWMSPLRSCLLCLMSAWLGYADLVSGFRYPSSECGLGKRASCFPFSHIEQLSVFKRNFDVDACGLSCQMLPTVLASHSQASGGHLGAISWLCPFCYKDFVGPI